MAEIPELRLDLGEVLTVGDRVYLALRELLIAGQVQPGAKLPLRALAAQLGTSHMPVRDAVRRLMAECALEVLPNRAVRVPEMTVGRFEELTAIRLQLEPLAAERAAKHMDPAKIAEAARTAAAFSAAAARRVPERVSAMLEANRALHFLVYREAGMPQLVSMVESLWLQVGPTLRMCLEPRAADLRGLRAHDFHRLLVNSLRRHDPAGARRAVADDLTAAARFILSSGILRR
jgi:DNA-binding GntR family transcriptional regulator